MTDDREPGAAPPRISGFEFQRQIGAGGVADVFLYRRLRPQLDVAVKVLRPNRTTPELAQAFDAEAERLSILSYHPSVVTMYASGISDDGRPYLVMEYCPAGNLGQCVRERPLSRADALTTTIQIAGAVETAHRLSILHRDIKPANILIAPSGRPVLSDFGISSALGDKRPMIGFSVPWSPPESFDVPPAFDVATDVWALAATAYHLMTGRAPFAAPGIAEDEHIRRIRREPLPRLRDDSERLHRALSIAMAKRPRHRHPSALAFARELQEVQGALGYEVTPVDVLDDYGDVRDDGGYGRNRAAQAQTRIPDVDGGVVEKAQSPLTVPGAPRQDDTPATNTSVATTIRAVGRDSRDPVAPPRAPTDVESAPDLADQGADGWAGPGASASDVGDTEVPLAAADPLDPLVESDTRVSATRIRSDHPAPKDLLDYRRDVDRLARIVASGATDPPIAVAILGDWGTGKSTFMRLMEERVQELCAAERKRMRDAPAPRSAQRAQPLYETNICQVTFNAWQYSDDHVLVGMIDEVYRKLRAPEASRNTTKTPDRISTELAEITGRKELLEEYQKKILDGNVWDRWSARLGFTWSLLRRKTAVGGPPLFRLVLALAATLCLAVLGVYAFSPATWRTWHALWISLSTTPAVAFLLVALARVTRAQGLLSDAWKSVRRALASTATALDQELTHLEQTRARLEIELAEISAEQGLAASLAGHAADESLAGYRGMVSVVHEHMRTLIDVLERAQGQRADTTQDAIPENEIPSRFLLYIDDLERCSPSRVNEVLHAISLLLSLPRFVVIAGVDARWLSRALLQRDRDLYAAGNDDARAAPRQADPLEHLDKIFQIVFSLRSIRGRRGVGYLRQLLDRPIEPMGSGAIGPATHLYPPKLAASATPTDREIGVLGVLSSYLSTPRAVKKLVNLYHLVLADIAGTGFSESADSVAAALLLAALVEAPNQATDLMRQVLAAEGATSIAALVDDIAAGHCNAPDHPRCVECFAWEQLAAMFKQMAPSTDMAALRRWSREVCRYSFHAVALWEMVFPRHAVDACRRRHRRRADAGPNGGSRTIRALLGPLISAASPPEPAGRPGRALRAVLGLARIKTRGRAWLRHAGHGFANSAAALARSLRVATLHRCARSVAAQASMTTGMIMGRRRWVEETQRPKVRRMACCIW